MTQKHSIQPCGLWRRFACITYDTLVIMAILFLLTLVIIAFRGGKIIATGSLEFQSFLIFSHWLYFAYCWRFGRQTLGMRAWNVRITTTDKEVSWGVTIKRYIAASVSLLCLGLGYLSAIWHPTKMAWHDRLSTSWLEQHRH